MDTGVVLPGMSAMFVPSRKNPNTLLNALKAYSLYSSDAKTSVMEKP
jgi:hypothetical protein